MRLYTFTNYYLSSIQQGIQPLHAMGELVNKYLLAIDAFIHDPSMMMKANMISDWSRNHKTMIALNGGNCADLHELCRFFNSEHNPYPWASFNEDEASLGGALTSVAVILTDKIYNAAYLIRNDGYELHQNPYSSYILIKLISTGDMVSDFEEFTPYEASLVTKLNQYGLAK